MFYTYVYKDPRPTKNQQVVYVGKGTGRRMYVHWEKRVHKNPGFGAFLALLRKLNLTPIIELVSEFEDEADALFDEMRLIALYGRRDLHKGPLFNLTDGGEGFSGAVRTPEWRASIRDALLTDEQRTRNAEAAKARWSNPEYKAKTTAAIREALKDPEVIARREAGKAAFIHTDEFKATMQQAATKMWQDPSYAEKVKAAQLAGHKKPGVREKKSATSKAVWAQHGEKMAKGIKATRSTEESRAKTVQRSKKMWKDPEYHAKQTANNKEIANRPEVKAAKAAATKAMWADPVRKAAMLEKRRINREAKKALAALDHSSEWGHNVFNPGPPRPGLSDRPG